MSFLLIAAVGLLSFANGANDNFKGGATLWGAGKRRRSAVVVFADRFVGPDYGYLSSDRQTCDWPRLCLRGPTTKRRDCGAEYLSNRSTDRASGGALQHH